MLDIYDNKFELYNIECCFSVETDVLTTEEIRVITKLPISEQSSKRKVYKQTKSVNNRKTVKTVMTLTWYRHFERYGGLNQILKRQTSHFHYGSKVPAVTMTVFITILEQNR